MDEYNLCVDSFVCFWHFVTKKSLTVYPSRSLHLFTPLEILRVSNERPLSKVRGRVFLLRVYLGP